MARNNSTKKIQLQILCKFKIKKIEFGKNWNNRNKGTLESKSNHGLLSQTPIKPRTSVKIPVGIATT